MSGIRRDAVAVGVATGMFSGLTGVGGGALVVSLMVSVLGLTQRVAQGTAPAVIIPVAFFGAITYAVQGISGQFPFDTPLAVRLIPALAIPSIFGVVIGATWMSALPASQLRRAFGVFLFFVSASMLLRGPEASSGAASIATDVPFIFWVLLGFVSGVFSGFLGIGGAMVMIPFMTLGAGISQHMTQGITLGVVAITTLAGAYTNYRLHNLDARITLLVAPTATVVVVIASVLAGRIDAFWLTKICGIVLGYFAFQFTFRAPAKGPTPPTPTERRADPNAGFYSI